MSNQKHHVAWITCFLLSLFFSSSAGAFQESVRTWKDASGKFEIKATFVKVEGEYVILEKENGKTLSVPMEKLSAVDQGFIQGLLAAGGHSLEENPFADSSSTSSSNRTKAPNKRRNNRLSDRNSTSSSNGAFGSAEKIEVDFEECAETAITTGQWNPVMSAPPTFGFDVKAATLPGKRDFFEKLEHAAFNPFAKRAVLSYHLGRPGRRGGETSTRLTVVDIATGQKVSNSVIEGLWKALAIDDQGDKIVLRKGGSESNKNHLATVRINNNKVSVLDEWTPYASMSEADKEKMVNHAHFINEGRLFTLSQNGRAVIWDFENRVPLRRFRYHGACQPTLTADRSQVVICGGDLIGVVNLDDESVVPSVKAAPRMNYWLSSAISPSGKRFAAATMSKLMVWDLESGNVLFEGSIPGLPVNGAVHFPHEDYVLVNNDKLFDFANRIKVWHYQGGRINQVGDQTVFSVVGKDETKVLPIEIPHAEALTWLKRAQEDSDLFVLKKGAKVGIDVRGVPSKYRGDVEQALKENMDRMGFVFASNADLVFKATIDGPTNEAVRYHFAGNFVVRQFNSLLNIEYDGKSIWGSRGNNVPGSVSGNSTAEVKKELEKAGRSPNIRFFASTNLPEFLQKPGEGSGSAGRAQMLGASKVGVNGLER